MIPFGFALPGQILFGRGEAAKAPGLIKGYGPRGLIVHGANASRASWLIEALGPNVLTLSCPCEPTLPMLEAALSNLPALDWIAAIGGGAVLDFGKALAALIPAPGGVMDHLEVVGRGLPLKRAPLPFTALPTTAGTGAEATRNAVIGLPDHGRKVSIRDLRMLPDLAIIDPALTDHCPRPVTLASGLDALAQVIEPYVSTKANPLTDALTEPAIATGITALMRLMEAEDPEARDRMAWVSLSGGIALANGGLGAVHGLAGVIGGVSPAPHGAVCGALLGPVLALNRRLAEGEARARLDHVCEILAGPLGCEAEAAPAALSSWARASGLPNLTDQGLNPALHGQVAEASLASSSMKGNAVSLTPAQLEELLVEAG